MKKFLPAVLVLCAIRMAGQVPLLSSDPSTTSRVIYLDFDGQVVSGTSWNNGNTVNAQPSNASAATILQIWKRISEDYRPFSVNVTTDLNHFNNAPANRRIRVIFTPTSSWYGNAGGVAFLGSFTWGGTAGTPCWVFENNLGNSAKSMAEAASHEVGHTLSLRHQSQYSTQCVKINEYHGGQGSGMTSWAPIMGVGYNRNVTIWHSGPNALGCNVIQNDHGGSGITGLNYLSYRPDDVGNTLATAKFLNLNTALTTDSGLITQPTDIDAYRFTICDNRYVSINAKPWALDTVNYSGANLDIRLALYDASNNLLAIDTSLIRLRALVGMNLTPGTYYFTIDGGRSNNYSDYGSLGKYYLSIKATNPPPVSAAIGNFSDACDGATVSLSATPSGTVASWLWTVTGPTNLTSTLSTPTPTLNAGTHTVSLLVSDGTYTGCAVTSTLAVTPFPTLSVTGNTILCPGKVVTLIAGGAETYTWNPGSGTNSMLVVHAATPLSYTLAGANGLCQSTAAVSVSLNPTFTVELVPSKTLVCLGDTLMFTAGGATSYTLSPGSLTGNTAVVAPGISSNYYLTGKVGGCEQTVMSPIIVIPDADPGVVASTSFACYGDVVTFTASGAGVYTFQPGSITNNPATYTVTSSMVYTVAGSNHSMCATKTTTTFVQVMMCGVGLSHNASDDVQIFPNPAQDAFTVEGKSSGTLEVFSILGERVYEKSYTGGAITVQCAEWSRGIYLVRLTYGNSTAFRRIVIR